MARVIVDVRLRVERIRLLRLQPLVFSQCLQRAIADGQRLIRVGRREQLIDFGDRQDSRQRAPALGRFHALARIARGDPFAHQKLEIRTDRRDLTANRRRCEP